MTSNKNRDIGGRLKRFSREVREVYLFIKGDKVIARNLSFRLLLFLMAGFLVVNMVTQHKRTVIEDNNIKLLAEIFNNPELSKESIELVRISVK